jgi:hypothetical protein
MLSVKRFLRRATVASITVLLATACGGSPQSQVTSPIPEGASRLIVNNRSLTDMDIYMVKAGARTRLGMAPGGKTSEFNLMQGQVAGVGTIHFVAEPFGASGRAVTSEPVHMGPGSVVTFDISPQ